MGAACGKDNGISLGNGQHDGGELGGESERIRDREKAAARKKAQAMKDKQARESTSGGNKARRGSLTDNLQRFHAPTQCAIAV